MCPTTDATAAQADEPNLPVTCVDVCDAIAYCAWAGKSLCGGNYQKPADPEESPWFAACAGESNWSYPYGRDFDRARCNGSDNPAAGCQSGNSCRLVPEDMLDVCSDAQGVVHMSGNASEWTAACDGRSGHADKCRVRGGSVGTGMDTLSCRSSDTYARDFTNRYLGFRCCAP